jgi:hypothetical protein
MSTNYGGLIPDTKRKRPMTLYGGIDPHSNNAMISIIDAQTHLVCEKRLPTELQSIQAHEGPYGSRLDGLVVESEVGRNS